MTPQSDKTEAQRVAEEIAEVLCGRDFWADDSPAKPRAAAAIHAALIAYGNGRLEAAEQELDVAASTCSKTKVEDRYFRRGFRDGLRCGSEMIRALKEKETPSP
jgi:hypothetical protein